MFSGIRQIAASALASARSGLLRPRCHDPESRDRAWTDVFPQVRRVFRCGVLRRCGSVLGRFVLGKRSSVACNPRLARVCSAEQRQRFACMGSRWPESPKRGLGNVEVRPLDIP